MATACWWNRSSAKGARRTSIRSCLLRRFFADLRTGVAGAPWARIGAQAGEAELRAIMVDEVGFSRSRRATETPKLVLEARP